MPKTTISLRELKKFASAQLPKDWELREILISEDEKLSVQAFLARLPIWLKLSEMEGRKHALS